MLNELNQGVVERIERMHVRSLFLASATVTAARTGLDVQLLGTDGKVYPIDAVAQHTTLVTSGESVVSVKLIIRLTLSGHTRCTNPTLRITPRGRSINHGDMRQLTGEYGPFVEVIADIPFDYDREIKVVVGDIDTRC